MIEWIGTKLLAGSEIVGEIAAWADAHPLVAVPVGIFLLRILDDIVRKTPTKYDDVCLDIFTDAVKAAFNGVQRARKRKARNQ